VLVPAQALEAGVSGNVSAGAIVNLGSALPYSTSVMNPESAAGGDDAESDASLRERARSFFAVARRGTLAAIEQGALTVAGVRQATAIEYLDSYGDPNGHVDLYIADALGQANALLVSAVTRALVEWRAAGVIVVGHAAVPYWVGISLRLRYRTGIDSVLAFAAVRTAVAARVNALAPGATLEASSILETARLIEGVIVLEDALVVPAGDVVPSSGQIIRTAPELVVAAT
jgi:uncharacterized phage protein gp47/JayE